MLKPRPASSSGPGPMYAVFVVSVAVAFWIGYRMGSRPAPAGAPVQVATSSQASSPASRAGEAPQPASSARPRFAPVAEQPRMIWATVGGQKYTLYLASFKKMADAEKERQRLESNGLRGVEITERRMPGTSGAPWYRLRYGAFETREAAIEYGRQLADRGWIRDFWPKEM